MQTARLEDPLLQRLCVWGSRRPTHRWFTLDVVSVYGLRSAARRAKPW